MPSFSTRLEDNALHITNGPNCETSSTTKAHNVKT